MKRLLAILSILILVVPRGITQEWGDGLDFTVFESDREKSILLQEDVNAFQLLGAIHAEENVEMKSYDKLIKKLDKRSKNKEHQEWFLNELYYKTHNILLKEYKKHSTFNALLNEGVYDCVSASALYALLLDRYGFDYQLIETDFHVFLIVETNEKSYVFESTEPRSGFIKDQEMVREYVTSFLPDDRYSTKLNQSLGGISEHRGQENTIYKSISIVELAGLQYYNDAIQHFNEDALERSLRQLAKAKLLYPSDRITAFEALVMELKAENKN